MTKTNKVFMAFATGKESTDGTQVKRYIGVAPVYVLGVNPTKTELEKLYGTELENDPIYVGETEVGPEGDKKKVAQIRLDYIVKTDESKCNGIEMTTKVSMFLANEYKYTKDKSKVQVINKYGECTWLPIENAKAGTIPENLSWFEAAEFRPAFIGEEELVNFIKSYLGVPNKSYKDGRTGNIVELKDKSDAEARLDKITNYFKGDISELKNILALQPNNRIKVMFGVKTTDDNKQYQAAYTQKFLKNSITDYSKLDKDLQDRKAAGALANTKFSICPLKEYTVEPTDFGTTTSFDNSEVPYPWAGK